MVGQDMTMNAGASGRRYCVISPVRDESKFMRRTLDSVLAQTVPPTLWVIVDDGSTDATPEILQEYAARHPSIRIVTRARGLARRVGGGVVEAFNDALATVDLDRFDYLCKLDMDLDLPPRYFEGLLELMEADPRLGTFSGKAYFPGPGNPEGRWGGELISEEIGDDVSIGAAKFWRARCFREIGGLVVGVMWDGIDCYTARMKGWKVGSIDREDLRFIHLRPMGSSVGSIFTGRQRWGRGHWFMGSSPLFVLASAVNRARYRPVVLGSLAMLWGYLKAAWSGHERFEDAEFRQYLRRYQHALIRHGKMRARDRFEAAGAGVWKDETPVKVAAE